MTVPCVIYEYWLAFVFLKIKSHELCLQISQPFVSAQDSSMFEDLEEKIK